MKNILKHITSVSLAFLVLFSTLSVTINQHYCGDTLVDTTLYAKADTCKMEMNVPTSENTMLSDNCCKDVIKHIEGQDDLKLDFSKLDLQQKIFITSFVYTYINLFEDVSSENNHFKDYSPPLIVKDIYSLDEVYLI